MKYKLVVTDMDGTLLNSKGKVPDENQQVLKKLQEEGVHVAVATGRIYTSARVFAKYLGIKTPIIACNGAIVRDIDKNDTIYETHIDKQACIEIIDICRKYDVYFHFYTDDTFYTEKLENSALRYSEWNKTLNEEDRIKVKLVENAHDVIKNTNEKIYKFLIINEDLKLLSKIREEFDRISSVECCKSYYNNLEIMSKGVQKGVAVKNLANSLGVKQEEVVCIGDNENDLSMIKYAGLGIAMGNAEDIVKDTADYVTDINDNNGVAKALKKFVRKS